MPTGRARSRSSCSPSGSRPASAATPPPRAPSWSSRTTAARRARPRTSSTPRGPGRGAQRSRWSSCPSTTPAGSPAAPCASRAARSPRMPSRAGARGPARSTRTRSSSTTRRSASRRPVPTSRPARPTSAWSSTRSTPTPPRSGVSSTPRCRSPGSWSRSRSTTPTADRSSNLRLNARLVAKLVTGSYRSGGNTAVIDNPVNLFRDPEFRELNPTMAWPGGAPGNHPLLLGDLSDTTIALTRWIAADKDARDFVIGQARPVGHDGQRQLQEGGPAVRELPAARPADVGHLRADPGARRAGAAALAGAVPGCPGHPGGRRQHRDQAPSPEPRAAARSSGSSTPRPRPGSSC